MELSYNVSAWLLSVCKVLFKTEMTIDDVLQNGASL